MDINVKIKQIKKQFFKQIKEFDEYLKIYNKNHDDDLNYFYYNSCYYNKYPRDEQEELEKVVLDKEDFFKLVGKLKINIKLLQLYGIVEQLNKKELDLYIYMLRNLNDMQFSKQFKVNLMKKTMIDFTKQRNDNSIEKNDHEI